MRRRFVLAAGGLILLAGCVQVPERVDVNVGGPRYDRVEGSRAPATHSHAEARDELERAYAEVRSLRRENARLRDKLKECEDKLDACEARLERYEDR